VGSAVEGLDVAAVEDCRSLEILLVTAEQLRSWSEVPST
jgi:hypothetical protein